MEGLSSLYFFLQGSLYECTFVCVCVCVWHQRENGIRLTVELFLHTQAPPLCTHTHTHIHLHTWVSLHLQFAVPWNLFLSSLTCTTGLALTVWRGKSCCFSWYSIYLLTECCNNLQYLHIFPFWYTRAAATAAALFPVYVFALWRGWTGLFERWRYRPWLLADPTPGLFLGYGYLCWQRSKTEGRSRTLNR